MLFIFLILMISIPILSQKKLEISGFVETGWLNNIWAIQDKSEVHIYAINNPVSMYATVFLKFSYKKVIHYENTIINTFEYTKGRSFSVIDAEFVSKLYYNNGGIFSIGYEHYCLHPLVNQFNELKVLQRRGSGDKIFIKFKF